MSRKNKNGSVLLHCQQCKKADRRGIKSNLYVDDQGFAKCSIKNDQNCSPLTKKEFEIQQLIFEMRLKIKTNEQGL